MPARYRRRTGLHYRRASIGPDPRPNEGILDGGRDAPLSRRGRFGFRILVVALVVGGIVFAGWVAISAGPGGNAVARRGEDAGAKPSLSVLERSRESKDTPPEMLLRGFESELADPTDVRLAFDGDGHQVFVGRGKTPGSICFMMLGPTGGGGGCGDFAENVATRGGMIGTNESRTGGFVVTGIVPNDVTTVRVDGEHATLGENAFVIKVSSPPETVELVTDSGTRTVSLRSA